MYSDGTFCSCTPGMFREQVLALHQTCRDVDGIFAHLCRRGGPLNGDCRCCADLEMLRMLCRLSG